MLHPTRTVAPLLLPVCVLAGSLACTVEDASNADTGTPVASDDTAAPHDTTPDPPVPEVCLEPGPAGAADGYAEGSLSGIVCSPSTCLCSGFTDVGGGLFRAWWEADFLEGVAGSSEYAGVVDARCAPGDDQCRFRLDFGAGDWFATMNVWFEEGSIHDVERADTYVSMTEVRCSGNTYECVGTIASSSTPAAVWSVGVAQR